MFRKLGRALGGAKAGSSKVKLELVVQSVERLPQSVKKCRVVWVGKSSAKLQMTAVKDVRNGVAQFKEALTQVAGLHKDKKGDYEPKEYTVKVQAPQGTGSDNMVTVGKAAIDLAQFVEDGHSSQSHTLQITFKVGSSTSTGVVKLVINSTHLGDMSEDGMTEVSGMTGLTSEQGGASPDQDLEGFDDNSLRSPHRASGSKDSKRSNSTPGAAGRKGSALPTMEEGDDAEHDSDDAGAALQRKGSNRLSPLGVVSRPAAAADPFSKKANTAAKPPARKRWEDEDSDISPVGSDLSEDDARPPPKKPEPKKVEPPKPKEPEMGLNEMKSSLFNKKKPADATGKAAAAPAAASSRAGSKGSIPEDEESARAALFAAPSKAAGKAGDRSGSKADPSPPPAVDEEEERAALFTSTRKSAASASSKQGKEEKPSAAKGDKPTAGQADKPGKGDKAAKGGLFGFGKSAAKSSTPEAEEKDDKEELDEDTARAALFSAPAKPRAGSAKPPAPASRKAPASGFDFDDDAFGNEPAFAPASSKPKDSNGKKLPAAAPNRGKPSLQPPPDDDNDGSDLEEDELGVAIKKSSSKGSNMGRAGSLGGTVAPAPAGPASADRSAEVRKLQAENEELHYENEALQSSNSALQAQVSSLQASEGQLSKQLAQAQDNIRQLEDKLIQNGRAQQEATSQMLAECIQQMEQVGLHPYNIQGAAPHEQLAAAISLLCDSIKANTHKLQAASTMQADWRQEHAQMQATINNLLHEQSHLQAQESGHAAERQQLLQQVAALTEQLDAATASAAAAGATASQLESRVSLSRSMSRIAAASGTLPSHADSAALLNRSTSQSGHESVHQLQRLARDKEALEQQVLELEYQLKQARRGSGINQQSMKVEMENVMADLAHANAEASRLALQLEALQDENEQLRAEHSAAMPVKRCSSGSNSMISSSTFAELQAQCASVQQKNEVLQQSLHTAQQESNDAQQRVTELEQERQELKARLDEFSEAETIVKEWAQYAEGLVAERDALLVQLQEAQARLPAEQLEPQTLKAAQESPHEITDTMPEDRKLLQQELDAVNSKAHEFETTNEALQQEKEGLQAQVVELQATSTELQAQLQHMQRLEAGSQQQRTQLQAQVKDLQASIAAHQTQPVDVEQLRHQLQQAQDEAAAAVAELQQAQADVTAAAAAAVAARSMLEAEHAKERTPSSAMPSAKKHRSTQDSTGSSSDSDGGRSSRRSQDDEQLHMRSRGWSPQVEMLLAEKLGLQAQVDALQAALAAATQQPTRQLTHQRSDTSDASISYGYRHPPSTASGKLSTGMAKPGHLSQSRRLQLASMEPDRSSAASVAGSTGRQKTVELHQQLAAAQREVLALQSLLAQAPLLQPVTGQEVADEEDNEAAHVAQLQQKVDQLTQSRIQAQSELEAMKNTEAQLVADKAAAIKAAADAELLTAQLSARLAARDAAVQDLQGQLSQLHAELEASKKAVQAQHRMDAKVLPLIPTARAATAPMSDITAMSSSWIGSHHGRSSEDCSEAASSDDMHRAVMVSDDVDSRPLLLGSGRLLSPKSDAPLSEQRHDRAHSKDSAASLLDTEAGRLAAQLQTAAAGVHMTRRTLAACMSVLSSKEPYDISEDVNLDVALLCLKDEAACVLRELRSQAQEAPRFEAQVAAATQRVVELEAQLQELQEENQQLAGLQHPLLHGRASSRHQSHDGTLRSRTSGFEAGLGPCLSGPMTDSFKKLLHNPLYGDNAGLAISAMEQQLALTQSQMHDAQTSVQTLQKENCQLRKELEHVHTRNVVEHQVSIASKASAGKPGGKATGRSKTVDSDDDSDSQDSSDEPVRGRGGRQGSARGASKASKVAADVEREMEQLRQHCSQLEEALAAADAQSQSQLQKSQSELQKLQRQLDAATAEAQSAQDMLQQEQAKRQTDNQKPAAGSSPDVRKLRQQLSEMERQVSELQRENVSLAEQLEEEQGMREDLEHKLKRGLADVGEDEVLETVEAFEAKYSRLKDRHKRAEVAAAQQVADLQAALADAHQQLEALESANSTGMRSGGRGAAAAPAANAGGLNMKEAAELRQDNEALLAQLVAKQMEAAELEVQLAVLRRDLYRVKEVNMKLASKMTRLEAQAMSQVHEKKRLFGGKKKQASYDGSEQQD